MSVASLSPKSSNESLNASLYSESSIPDTLAPAVSGPMVWEGTELDPAKYVVGFNEQEIRDVRAAVIKCKSKCTLKIDQFRVLTRVNSWRYAAIGDFAGDF